MKYIPVSKPFFTQNCKDYMKSAIDKEEISGNFGEFIPKFENKFSEFCGTKYAVSCSNGTTALHLAILALGLGKNDEILVSTTTNMATFFAVDYVGAIAVPVDINPDTYTIDLKDLESKITRKTKAIICVHLFGQLCDMNGLMRIANKNNLKVIEDCAEAHGAKYKNQSAGSFGDFGTFSFFSNKLLTCGEGGMVTTNSKTDAENLKNIKTLAFGKKNKFVHTKIGYNYRLSNVACALGYSQTIAAEKIINGRIKVAEKYLELLNHKNKYIKLPCQRKDFRNVYWMFHIELQGPYKYKRSDIIRELLNFGIETREGFYPYHLQSYHNRKYTEKECENATNVANNTLYLPTFNKIEDLEIEYVTEKLLKILGDLN